MGIIFRKLVVNLLESHFVWMILQLFSIQSLNEHLQHSM